jgi:tellurite resistance protein
VRPYPRNSPRAAARIVALTMVSDGQLQNIEMTTLESLHAHQRLGLQRFELHAAIHDFCADLLEDARASNDDDCRISPASIELMLADIDDPALRRKVIELCAGVARADGRVDDGESIVLSSAIAQWGIAPEGFENLLEAADARSGTKD